MSELQLQPIIPAHDESNPATGSPQEPPEPAPITEQEVGEYREQDRFLPVSRYPLYEVLIPYHPLDSERFSHNEVVCASYS